MPIGALDPQDRRVLTAKVAGPAALLTAKLHKLGERTEQAIAYLRTLFANGPHTVGALMARRAEEGIGNPEFVAASAADLAARLLLAVGDNPAISRPAALDRAPRL